MCVPLLAATVAQSQKASLKHPKDHRVSETGIDQKWRVETGRELVPVSMNTTELSCMAGAWNACVVPIDPGLSK